MQRKGTLVDIGESINQILHGKDALGELFYDHFLSCCPEAQQFFADIDMKRQGILLTTALMVVERHFSNPTPAVDKYLEYLGTKHDEMNIPQSLYAKWADAMIETITRYHGDQWDQALETHWRQAITKATETMFEGYRRHITI